MFMVFAAVAVIGLMIFNAYAVYDGISARRRINKLEAKVDALAEDKIDKLLLG